MSDTDSHFDSDGARVCISRNRERPSASGFTDFNDYLIDVRRRATSNPPRDPTPRYPRWVVVVCIILSIVGFIFGFVRSC